MKKMIVIALFSTSLLAGVGNVSVYAQEVEGKMDETIDNVLPDEPSVPTDPIESNESEKPNNPSIPEKPIEPSEPEQQNPSLPDESNVPTDPTLPSESEKPVDPTNPTDQTQPNELEKPTEPSKPVEPGKPVVPSNPTEPNQPVVPSQPDKPVDIVVTPSGEINHSGNTGQQSTIPIETNNLAEVTHVPTMTTPIETANGEAIVAVEKGIPLTKTDDGLKPIMGEYKVLPSGNVEVKAKDGKMKILPHTGEEMGIIGSIVGMCMTILSGILFYKKV